MATISKLQREASALKVALEAKEKELDEATSRRLIQCTSNCYGKGCGKKSQIRNLVYIRLHYYVEPFSCTGGDYWLTDDSDAQFDCPACGHRNRLYDRQEFMKLSHLFKKVVNSHDRHNHPPHIDKERG